MLYKLSLKNIRRSLRDYSVYFFTLVLGVAIFYVFNAVGTQAAFLKVQENTYEILDLLTQAIAGLSIFIAFVLGFLVVYASRFLVRRRNREFALYMTLGMGKRSIARILSMETIVIGILSLAVGLAAGIGLSQIMSTVVAQLFEADMTAFAFTFSLEAFWKTILCFVIIQVVVAVFDLVMIGKSRLIDLLRAGRGAEKVRMKHPAVCVVVFLLGAALLAGDYYFVTNRFLSIMGSEASLYLSAILAAGAAGTFLVLWSASGLLLGIVSRMRSLYLKGVNSFTFRQVSSRINTMVVSITVICLMLFVTICVLSAALSLRTSLNRNLQLMAPADAELIKAIPNQPNREAFLEENPDFDPSVFYLTARDVLELEGLDPEEIFTEYVYAVSVETSELTTSDTLGGLSEELKEKYTEILLDTPEDLMGISDYNRLAELFGIPTYTLEGDEYILLCDYSPVTGIRSEGLKAGTRLSIRGITLRPKYDTVQEGFMQMSQAHTNYGIVLVPDAVMEKILVEAKQQASLRIRTQLAGNYAGDTREEKERIQEMLLAAEQDFAQVYGWYPTLNTKTDIRSASIGLGAIVTFIGLYLGLVFLIASAAILALKALSDSIDSRGRYDMLRRIGTPESSIRGSLLKQEMILFLMPLLLACIHSIFGIKTAAIILETIGTGAQMSSILIAALIILLIYGGYFLITYLSSRAIIKERQ